MINSISKNIKEGIYKEFYYPILKKCEFISIYFNTTFTEKLSLHMREANYSEGNQLLKKIPLEI